MGEKKEKEFYGKQKEHFIENAGRLYYERGKRYFELGKYEEAVEDWIQAYNLDFEKEDILNIIYNCFIVPNEQEFKNNFTNSIEGFSELSFEECVLDFIPVNQDKFYIFDRENQGFCGAICLEKTPIYGEEVEFDNILYADVWDVREMLKDMKKSNRDLIYVILDGVKSRFISFLKLPSFREVYFRNVVAFDDEFVMRAVFEEYEEFYLPKEIVSANIGKYKEIIDRIHEKRIRNLDAERKNIFLSICIPSYNRGRLALESVKRFLNCSYDSEIEIILSNNGSNIEQEYYKAIRDIGDVRVRYHEFDENQGFASNMLKVCELAKGRYAVIISDEDWLILYEFKKYLNFIKAYPCCGVFRCKVNGCEFRFDRNCIIGAGIEAVKEVSTWTSMSGLVFNMELFHELEVLESLRQIKCDYPIDWRNESDMLRGTEKRNLQLEILTHESICMMLAYNADVAITVVMPWDAKRNEQKEPIGFKFLCKPKARIELQNSCMELCIQCLKLEKEEFVDIFLEKCERIHHLIRVAFVYFFEDMLEFGSEWETQAWIHQEQMKYLDYFPFDLTKEEYSRIQKEMSKMIFY